MSEYKNRFLHWPAREYCESRGLVWDHQMAEEADRLANHYGLSQDAFTAAVKLHVDAINRCFTPQIYPWSTRVKLAVFFFWFWLGLIKRKRAV